MDSWLHALKINVSALWTNAHIYAFKIECVPLSFKLNNQTVQLLHDIVYLYVYYDHNNLWTFMCQPLRVTPTCQTVIAISISYFYV